MRIRPRRSDNVRVHVPVVCSAGEHMEVQKIGSCIVISIKLGENRLNPEFITAFHDAMDRAEA